MAIGTPGRADVHRMPPVPGEVISAIKAAALRLSVLAGILLVFALFSILNANFFTVENLRNMLLQSIPLIMVGVAMSIALILKAVDLSVAYTADLSAIVCVALLLAGQPAVLCIAVGLGVGITVGILNGLIIINGVPALVGTLGVMFIIKSVELAATGGGQPLLLFSLPASQKKGFLFLGQGTLLSVPTQVAIGVAIVLCVLFLLHRTRIGRYFRAIGGNEEAAYLSGVRTKLYFVLAFVFSGVLSSVAGIMNVTRTEIAQPEGSTPLLLDAFIASYIGSIVFQRGKVNIPGTVVGALFVTILSTGVLMMGLGVVYQYIVKGILIFFAVALGRVLSIAEKS